MNIKSSSVYGILANTKRMDHSLITLMTMLASDQNVLFELLEFLFDIGPCYRLAAQHGYLISSV